MIHRTLFSLVLLLFACIVVQLSSSAHPDEPGRIGEYRVWLNNFTITKYSEPIGGDDADIVIHTFTQAETHAGQDALFGEYVDFVDEDETPRTEGIGKLIYWHLDCTDSENLSLLIDVVDIDGSPGPVIKTLLLTGAGIVTAANPVFGAAAIATSNMLNKAITAELSKEDRFPQWSSGDLPGQLNSFNFGANSGTWILDFDSGSNPSGNDWDYEVEVTFQYLEHSGDCNLDSDLRQKATQIRARDSAVQDLFNRLSDNDGDGVSNQVERAAKSNPNDPKSKPEHLNFNTVSDSCHDEIDNDRNGVQDNQDSKCQFLDNDKDGVEDVLDNCMMEFNPDQINSDSDSAGDLCDTNPVNPIRALTPMATLDNGISRHQFANLTFFDANKNCIIDDLELFTSIDLWVDGQIDDDLFFDVVDVWISQERVCSSISGENSKSKISSQIAVLRSFSRYTFIAQDGNTSGLLVEIYDLSGKSLIAQDSASGRLSWNLKDSLGRRVANGVYLYRVISMGSSGDIIHSEVRKLVLAR